jgi:hypothetical protein
MQQPRMIRVTVFRRLPMGSMSGSEPVSKVPTTTETSGQIARIGRMMESYREGPNPILM